MRGDKGTVRLWRREVNQQTESPLTCVWTSKLIRIVNAISDSITPFVHINTFPRRACEFAAWALVWAPGCQGRMAYKHEAETEGRSEER